MLLRCFYSLGNIPVDSGTRRNGLSEADPDVPAKLAHQRLERSEEVEALSGCQVVGEDDLLQLGVAEHVEVKIPGEIAAQPPVRVLDRPFLPGGITLRCHVLLGRVFLP